jgi:thioredoxin 1
MIEITVSSLDELDSVISGNPLVLADFGKDNCPGCSALDRTLEQLKGDPQYSQVTLVKAKVEQLGRQAFVDLGLKQAPSLLMYRDGDEMYRMSGFTNPASVRSTIDEHLMSEAA